MCFIIFPCLFKVNHYHSNAADCVNSLVAGSARRRLVLITTLFHEARPRLLGWWNDLFACSPVFVVFVLLAGISLNATTVVYVSPLERTELLGFLPWLALATRAALCFLAAVVTRASRRQRRLWCWLLFTLSPVVIVFFALVAFSTATLITAGLQQTPLFWFLEIPANSVRLS